jgi:hypothetical protein
MFVKSSLLAAPAAALSVLSLFATTPASAAPVLDGWHTPAVANHLSIDDEGEPQRPDGGNGSGDEYGDEGNSMDGDAYLDRRNYESDDGGDDQYGHNDGDGGDDYDYEDDSDDGQTEA